MPSPMNKPLNQIELTLDENAAHLLEMLAGEHYEDDRSRTLRAALETLAVRATCEGWRSEPASRQASEDEEDR